MIAGPPSTCSRCGATIPPDAPEGFCLLCLAREGAALRRRGRSLQPGLPARFAGYEVLGEIGRGGMGRVYRVRQRRPDRVVALKAIPADEMVSPSVVERFRIEAEAAASLDHPNIVPIYEVGAFEEWHFFSMRLIEGQSLAQALLESPMPYDRAAELVSTVARAIQHAHERGVLHRDLKPGNILLDRAGVPHVTDFGLAKFTGRETAVTLTQAALGTPAYMSPEQAAGRTREITTATDVYGLGAILYELLAGRPPFVGTSVVETLRMVTDSNPPALLEVPPDLGTVCQKCLHRRPDDRYPSAEALADDIDRFRRGEPVSARPLPPAGRLLRWAQRRPAIASLLSLLALSLATGAVIGTGQWRDAERARAAQGLALEQARSANAEKDRSLAHLRWQEIGHWLEDGDAPRALAFLASLIRERPGNWQAAMYAMSILERNAFAVLAGPEIQPPSPLSVPARLAPGGQWVAGAGEDGWVRIWDTASGRERARVAVAAPVTALAAGWGASPLAIASSDGGIRLSGIDGAPGPVLPRTGTHAVREIRFLAAGAWLVARSDDRLEAWALAAPTEQPRMFQLADGVDGMDGADGGSRVVAWNRTEAVIWDPGEGSEVLRMTARSAFVRGTIAAGGRRVAVLDGAARVRIWEAGPGRELGAIDAPPDGGWAWVALSDSGGRLFASGASRHVRTFDVDSSLPVAAPVDHRYEGVRVVSSPDGRRVFSYGADGMVNAWDAATGREVCQSLSLGSGNDQAILSPSRDGVYILLGKQFGAGSPWTLGVWHSTVAREPSRHAVPGSSDFDGCRMSPDGRLGCLGLSPVPRCYIYELATGRVVLDQPTHGSVYVQLFSPDQKRLYALTESGWLHGWSLQTGEELWPPDRQSGRIRPGAITRDGSLIIAGHTDGRIRVHDAATGKVVRTLEHSGESRVLRFAPDGSGRFVSGSTDGLAHVWDVVTGEKVRTFQGHSGTVISAGWSPDSLRLATASYDASARVWDVASGQPVGEPMHHLAWLAHLEFSPDGRLLATACRDGTARLWDASTGRPRSPLMSGPSSVLTVRFTDDGACLLVQDHEGFRLWDTENAEPITVHHPEPVMSGLGVDGASYRAILSPDSRRVFIAIAANHGALWTISHPRGPAPDWFPEFLEAVGLLRLGANGSLESVPHERLLRLREQIAGNRADDFHTRWVREFLASIAR